MTQLKAERLKGSFLLERVLMAKDLRLTWTDCDEAENYVVPNVLSPRDLVFRPDIMDETVKLSSF